MTQVRNRAPGTAVPVVAGAQSTAPPVDRRNCEPGGTVAGLAASQFGGRGAAPHGRAARAPVGRLALLLLAAILAHALVAPRLAPSGAVPDLLLVATMAVAATVPARRAIGFGFAAGLAADLLLVTPFGLSAAAFTALARAGAALPPPRRAVLIAPRVVAAAFAGGALVMFGAAALGAGPAPPPAALGLLARASLTAGALAPPVFAATRRLAGGAGGPA